MPLSDFDPREFGVSGRCYLRKVDRGGDWGEGSSLESRIELIIEKVFDNLQEGVSVYMAESSNDVRRIAIAINSTRESPREKIRLLALSELDLEGFDLMPTPGDTSCNRADVLHRDIQVSHREEFCRLVERLLGEGRKPKNFSQNKMAFALELAEKEGCEALPGAEDDRDCLCRSEDL